MMELTSYIKIKSSKSAWKSIIPTWKTNFDKEKWAKIDLRKMEKMTQMIKTIIIDTEKWPKNQFLVNFLPLEIEIRVNPIFLDPAVDLNFEIEFSTRVQNGTTYVEIEICCELCPNLHWPNFFINADTKFK